LLSTPNGRHRSPVSESCGTFMDKPDVYLFLQIIIRKKTEDHAAVMDNMAAW
jgi:hypothetical protein